MKLRWRLFVLIGLGVFGLDQWTKLLVVKHLTPAFAESKRDTPSPLPLSDEERDAALDPIGFFENVAIFYGRSEVVSPCERPGARCPSIRVIDGFWDWRYTENPGAAWSMFAKLGRSFRVPFLVSIALGALLMIVVYVRKLEREHVPSIVALSLVAGGALGNVIDRIRLAYVIDFIDWYSGTYHFPTFNVADSAITCGLGILALSSILELRPKRALGGADAVR